MQVEQQNRRSFAPLGQLKGILGSVDPLKLFKKVFPCLDALFSAVVNFSEAAAEFHRRLEKIDKKE